jgi:hypothetical protein
MASLIELFKSIGVDKDYSSMDFGGLHEDLQGWGSDHPVFGQLMSRFKPGLVIEVGTWKGASVVHMAELAKKLSLPTKFICVDTWLGDDRAWSNSEYRKGLMLRNGYPSLFRQFVFNLRSRNLIDDVFPLPLSSNAAARLLKRSGVVADMIYIDGGHEEDDVALDLKLYYELLRPGGAMFGDDYSPEWIGVVRAVNRFCADRGLVLSTGGAKWFLAKPVV